MSFLKASSNPNHRERGPMRSRNFGNESITGGPDLELNTGGVIAICCDWDESRNPRMFHSGGKST